MDECSASESLLLTTIIGAENQGLSPNKIMMNNNKKPFLSNKVSPTLLPEDEIIKKLDDSKKKNYEESEKEHDQEIQMLDEHSTRDHERSYKLSLLDTQALEETHRKLLDRRAYAEIEYNLYVRFRVTLLEKFGPLLAADNLLGAQNHEISEIWNEKHPLEFLACLQNHIRSGKLQSLFQQLEIDPDELLELAQFALIEGERECQKIVHPLLYLKAQYVTMNEDGYNTDSFEPIDAPSTMITIDHLLNLKTKEKCCLIVKYLTEKLL